MEIPSSFRVSKFQKSVDFFHLYSFSILVFDVFSRVVYLDFPLNKHGKHSPENGLLEY